MALAISTSMFQAAPAAAQVTDVPLGAIFSLTGPMAIYALGDAYSVRLAIKEMDEDGGLSITAALDSDPTLGGVVDSIRWADGFPWTGYTDFPLSDDSGILLGSLLPIVVLPSVS